MTLKVDLLRLRKTMEDMKLPYCVINRCIKYFSPHIVELHVVLNIQGEVEKKNVYHLH